MSASRSVNSVWRRANGSISWAWAVSVFAMSSAMSASRRLCGKRVVAIVEVK
jgi:hypothetical protein